MLLKQEKLREILLNIHLKVLNKMNAKHEDIFRPVWNNFERNKYNFKNGLRIII